MPSVKLWNCTPSSASAPTKSTNPLTERPRRSSCNASDCSAVETRAYPIRIPFPPCVSQKPCECYGGENHQSSIAFEKAHPQSKRGGETRPDSCTKPTTLEK